MSNLLIVFLVYFFFSFFFTFPPLSVKYLSIHISILSAATVAVKQLGPVHQAASLFLFRPNLVLVLFGTSHLAFTF